MYVELRSWGSALEQVISVRVCALKLMIVCNTTNANILILIVITNTSSKLMIACNSKC